MYMLGDATLEQASITVNITENELGKEAAEIHVQKIVHVRRCDARTGKHYSKHLILLIC